jgi:hypothetical protein
MRCRVIDGADSTLDAMEKVPVNPKHRPLQEIKLLNVSLLGELCRDEVLSGRAGDNTCESDRGRSGVIKSCIALVRGIRVFMENARHV